MRQNSAGPVAQTIGANDWVEHTDPSTGVRHGLGGGPMRWFGRRREGTGGPGAGPREKLVGALREGSRTAELIGRRGDATEAAARHTALVARAERDLGPQSTDTWALRHQLAHWTGESGQPEEAVRQF